MRQIRGSFWEAQEDYKIIPVNGSIMRNGELVMIKGLSLAARNKYPELPNLIGTYVNKFGNMPMMLHDYKLMTFPIKNNWMDKPDLDIIKTSAVKAYNMLPRETTAAMIRPGGIDWKLVKPVIEKILDDRFVIYG